MKPMKIETPLNEASTYKFSSYLWKIDVNGMYIAIHKNATHYLIIVEESQGWPLDGYDTMAVSYETCNSELGYYLAELFCSDPHDFQTNQAAALLEVINGLKKNGEIAND